MSKVAISKPSLFSFKECLGFLNRSYDDCLYTLTSHSVSRAVWANSRIILITVSDNGDDLVIETEQEADSNDLGIVTSYVKAWFDMDRILTPFYDKLSIHPQFGYMAAKFAGLRQMNIPDVFEALCWSIYFPRYFLPL